MNKHEVTMKSKTTFHWLDSNRIRLAIRQKWTNPKLPWNDTFHWLDSNRIRLAIRQKPKNPKLSWNQKPLLIDSIQIEYD
jgi:hypothetical protein